MNEFTFINSLKNSLCKNLNENIIIGVGDDCAVFEKNNRSYSLVSTDTFNEGIHFLRKFSNFEDVGIKAVSAAISDICAMGGVCHSILVAISVPKDMPKNGLEEFMKGAKNSSKYCNVSIIGGDTTSSLSGFSTTITVLGEVKKENLKLRSTAKSGEKLYVSTMPGLSLAGLKILEQNVQIKNNLLKEAIQKHLRPYPTYENKFYLNGVGAMIDISDGLASESLHIAKESALSVVLDEELLLKNSKVTKISKILQIEPLDLILNSGEEYALLFTADKSFKNSGNACEIGYLEDGDPKLLLRKSNKTMEIIKPNGFVHSI